MQDGEVWLTQDGIAQLFDVDRSVVTKHLKNIFQDGELAEKETRAKLNTTRVSNFFIGTRVVSYSESLALQGFPLFINNPDAS